MNGKPMISDTRTDSACEAHVLHTSVAIRRATEGDAEFLAWAILSASRGHLSRGWFDIALNLSEKSCLEFLRHLTTTSVRSRWHYSRFLVAETVRGAAAALAGFRCGEAFIASPSAVAEAAQSAGFPRQEHAQIWKRGSYMFTCSTRARDDCWVIESIATLPRSRNLGYASRLLETTLAEARALALHEAEITIVIGNDSAERAYRKAGFQAGGDRRHRDFEAATGAPGQRRLVQALC